MSDADDLAARRREMVADAVGFFPTQEPTPVFSDQLLLGANWKDAWDEMLRTGWVPTSQPGASQVVTLTAKGGRTLVVEFDAVGVPCRVASGRAV